jgi:2-polyprenyl-6-hydroxyphenyl methylase/3-demethylubiquinone-9 3-methyltransferase
MYPAGFAVRERWFGPRRFARGLEAVFSDVTIAHLLSPEEARRRIFRAIPRARLMTLWTAKKPGGGPVV